MKVVKAIQDAINEGVTSAVLLEDADLMLLLCESNEISLDIQDEIADLAFPGCAFQNNGRGYLINIEINGKQNLFPLLRLSTSIEEYLKK